MSYLDLKTLPVAHPLRNRPVAEIRAEVCNNATRSGRDKWVPVGPHWGIANNNFNQLGAAWLQYADWRAPEEAK